MLKLICLCCYIAGEIAGRYQFDHGCNKVMRTDTMGFGSSFTASWTRM